ncbi:MAG: hypothetical protein ACUVXF_04290 [Desulfobaccales bacterium]
MNPELPSSATRRSWLVLLAGLLVYVGVQGYLTVSPLRNWNLTPEVDDCLTYVLKSQQMRECFDQSCPALKDLRAQLLAKRGEVVSPNVAQHRLFAGSRVFPVYHPLFSVLLLGLSKTSLTLMEAYRFLWTLAPLIFGLSFAYWLTVLFGPGAAGVALMLLAFKVFPDTGLHHLVPSNLTMAIAVVMWARIIAGRGWAPWSLVFGSVVLVTMHLVGVIYAALGVVLALSLADPKNRRRLIWAGGAVSTLITILLLVARFVKKPAFVFPFLLPPGDNPWWRLVVGIGQNVKQVIVENVKLAEWLWGSPALFLGALVLGLATLRTPDRQVVLKILLIYSIFLGLLLFYVSNHPADVFLRVWIPLVVLLFGVVAQAICFTINLALEWWRQPRPASREEGRLNLATFWPVVAAAVLLGYAGEMIFRGAEQVAVVTRHLRDKEPLALYPSQPEMLLARARPGDRVLYTSLIVMDYYLIYGALRLGAIYYHPDLGGVQEYARWLSHPDLRFAVAFHPTVYHPSFEGRNEANYWQTLPDFRYSALSEARRHGPLAREGKIPAALYCWLDLKSMTGEAATTLNLLIDNPQGPGILEAVPLDPQGTPLEGRRQVLTVPGQWSGRLTVALGALPSKATIRLRFPRQTDRYQISGLTFGEGPLRWPWAQKALLTFYPREGSCGPVSVSFDPAALLPESLRGRRLSVLDDRGSSVLLELHP